ncbi:alpha/beta fold hydrolase [Desulfoluna spongiiphila]|uniref:alpha/beta fold hydrolase n=1 Tax=Desulfoluna spongiiphila TaxID=419481 RepID=UPI001256CF28|nr:alpha/beta fold hydrolase [Desulfoluna spongiiphila]VVS92950.1 alpha/beta hydrolase fold [Desulfoluna spongiiphila]
MREERTLSVLGQSLYTVCVEGNDAGATPIVLLHEGLGCVGMWHDFPEALSRATGRTVWAWDRWGYGKSSPLTEWEANSQYPAFEAETMLPSVLDALGIGEAHFFGHSDGGTIALLFGALFPERTAGIVVEACHVYVDELTVKGIADADGYFTEGTFREKLNRHHGSNTEKAFRRWADTWLSPSHRSWDITETIAAVTAPTLVIQGENDQYGTWGQVEAICRSVAGATSFKVNACRHVAHHEKRDEVVAALVDFFDRAAF